jgi:hypothetical protein
MESWRRGEPGGQKVLPNGCHRGRDVPVGLGQIVVRLGRQPGDPGFDRRVGRVDQDRQQQPHPRRPVDQRPPSLEPQPDRGEEAGRPVLGEDDTLVGAHEQGCVAGRCLGQDLRDRGVAVEHRLEGGVSVLAERPRPEDQPRPFLGLDRLGADDNPGEEAVHRRDVPAALGRRVVRGQPELELLERECATAAFGCHAAAFRSGPACSAFQAQGSSRSSSFALVRPETIRSSTSVSQARGSTPLSLAVATRLATIAQ